MLALAAALAIDLLFGEYPSLVHPVVWIGIYGGGAFERSMPATKWEQFCDGAILTLIVVGGVVGLVVWCDSLFSEWPLVRFVVTVFFLKASFALSALGKEGRRMEKALRHEDLGRARDGLRSLCSRDPSELDREELAAATIESLAENTSDSFVAPLFYYAILGIPGAMAYRAINTLDAMVGYRGKYEWLGKFAARLDDVANWIPARLTAALLLIAGAVVRADVAGGWRVMRRDGGKTASPNAGLPMAAMAGLLGVVLEKRGVYKLSDGDRPRTPDLIWTAWRIILIAAGIMVALTMTALAIRGR